MAGLYGDFEERLQRLIRDAPGRVSINSGYRSVDRQRQLWNQALQKYGSAEAADDWVAPPGNSMHNHGFAADLQYASPSVRRWVHNNASRYGLHFPLSNEDWHIELAKPSGGRYSTAEAQQLRQGGGGKGNIAASLSSISAAPDPTLRRGSRGQKVKDLQASLKRSGHYEGAVDGIFGPKTDAAVRSYQKDQGLTVDGIAGPNTWSDLNATKAPKTSWPEIPELPDLPSITDTGDDVAPLPSTDFGTNAGLMVVQDNLGKVFLINPSNESRFPVGGQGALNAALALTGQDSPATQVEGKPVYLSNWNQGPDVVELFGGPNQIERAVAGHKRLPTELGGGYVSNPQTITTGHGETYEPKYPSVPDNLPGGFRDIFDRGSGGDEGKYPDEPVPLPADILAQFEQHRRSATRAVEQARIERQRAKAAEESRFEQFKNRLSDAADRKRRDLGREGSARNLAFQPAFMGRGQRRIRDERADRMGQYQNQRTQRLQTLDQMVADAKRQREQTLADIERQKATLRSKPRDYMEALR